MTPEAAAVLALSRAGRDEPLAIPDAPIDEELLRELTTRHQIDALCWALLRDADPNGSLPLSPSLRTHFRRSYLHHRLRNESLLKDLAAISTALSARGLSALFLKGPWLMQCAYPEPGTRPVGDIDLCVNEKDFREVVGALLEVGYRPTEDLPDGAEAALRRAHYGRQLRFRAHGRRPLELHFRLVNVGPPTLDEEWVWRTSRKLEFEHFAIDVPGPVAMMLHLLLHPAQHGFAVLRLLHDIRWALHRDGEQLDEAALREQIHRLRCRPAAYHSLVLARDLAGADTGSLDLDALRPSRPRRALFERIWKLRAVRALDMPRRPMGAEAPRLYLLEMGGYRDKARYLSGLISEAGGVFAFLREAARVLPKGA